MTCQKVVQYAENVSINHEGIHNFLSDSFEEPQTYSSFDCHYTGPYILDYIFALDSLNFCFWPHATFDYQDLAMNLKQILLTSPTGLSPITLTAFTETDILKIFPPDFYNIDIRLQKLHELGSIIIEKFEGDYINLLKSCNNSVLKVWKIFSLLI